MLAITFGAGNPGQGSAQVAARQVVGEDLAILLIEEDPQGVEDIERQFQKQVAITARPNFHLEQSKITVG